MAGAEQVHVVGVVGVGVIGSGWAALCANRGLKVTAFTRSAQSEKRFRQTFAECHANLVARGLASGDDAAAWQRVTCCPTLAEAVQDADLVQESILEVAATKQQVLAEIEALAKPGVFLATSSSYLPRNVCALQCREPWRVVTAHPSLPQWDAFVEVLGADEPGTEWLARFYGETLQLDVVRLKKPHYGHAFNAMFLAWSGAAATLGGVCSDEDIDVAAVHLAKVVLASHGLSGALCGMVGGGSGQAAENLVTDIFAGAPLGVASSWLGATLGDGRVARVLLALLTPVQWVMDTRAVRWAVRCGVARGLAPLRRAWQTRTQQAEVEEVHRDMRRRVAHIERA